MNSKKSARYKVGDRLARSYRSGEIFGIYIITDVWTSMGTARYGADKIYKAGSNNNVFKSKCKFPAAGVDDSQRYTPITKEEYENYKTILML